jgi:hypothetical protein
MSKPPLHTSRVPESTALGGLPEGRFSCGPLRVAGGVPLSCPIFTAAVGASAPKGAPLASSAPPRRSAAVLGCVSHTTTTTLKEGST